MGAVDSDQPESRKRLWRLVPWVFIATFGIAGALFIASNDRPATKATQLAPSNGPRLPASEQGAPVSSVTAANPGDQTGGAVTQKAIDPQTSRDLAFEAAQNAADAAAEAARAAPQSEHY